MWDWNDRIRSMHTASRGFVTSVTHSPPVRMYIGCTAVQEEIVNSMYSIYSYIVNHVRIAYASQTIFPWKQTRYKSPFCLLLFFVYPFLLHRRSPRVWRKHHRCHKHILQRRLTRSAYTFSPDSQSGLAKVEMIMCGVGISLTETQI